MAVKIRLMRIGAKGRPFYRVVAVDERKKRTGAYLELLGTYNPLTEPKEILLKQDRIDAWIKNGAQMSDGFLRIIGKAPQKPPRKPKKQKNEPAAAAPAPAAAPEAPAVEPVATPDASEEAVSVPATEEVSAPAPESAEAPVKEAAAEVPTETAEETPAEEAPAAEVPTEAAEETPAEKAPKEA